MSIVCLADTHHPYHHQPSIDWALTMVKSLKAKRIVLLGDHIDLYSISRFSKDPTKRNIKKEIDSVKRFFKVDYQTFTNWQRGIVVCYSSKDIRSIVSPF